jgi:hypothetical protein
MPMKTYILRFLIASFLFAGSRFVGAAPNIGVGEFANEMVEPIGLVASLITTGSIMIGIGCLFGAFLRYSQYRINPLAAPIGSVILLVVLGLVLLALPMLNWVYSDLFV